MSPSAQKNAAPENSGSPDKAPAIPAHFAIKTDPVADGKAVVIAGNARFTVLAPRVMRLEYAPEGRFEDRASQAIWFRKQSVPQFSVKQSDSVCEIITEFCHLTYDISPRGFTPATLRIALRESGTVWHYGDVDPENLGGTVRTLDGRNGAAPLPPGLMSRSGWSLIDDSKALVFDDRSWLVHRNALNPNTDLYFFGHGRDYQGCLADFCRIAGPIPHIPRWILGNWWSRYWEYSENELRTLVNDFREHRIPLSVCVIDMDWHIVKNPHSGGWTGYTWNRELFPDPRGLLSWLHEQGLRTALNLHPADGVHPHEDAYEEFARCMGIDPATKKPVEFDITDPRFTAKYFELLHHPHEKMGVDFWWMDWQQGSATKLDGLDPLWWLNHLHYLDHGRNGVRRPFIFSRWGEWGNHRYPIGFSGDTHVTWDTLDFQPFFTATASNVGYCFWSHDIGGHYHGMEDPELYLRWIQFGVFSPILRIHSTKERFQDRRPWVNGDEHLRIARHYLQLRHALIPYLYTMCHKTSTECTPLIRPMYWAHADRDEAYCCPNQYYFGSELLAAPFTSPRDPDTQLSRRSVWLPAGDWYHFFAGEYHSGGTFLSVYGTLDEIPLFARAGAIVPLGPLSPWGNMGNPSEIDLRLFAGADGRFELYEDDGESTAFSRGVSCRTCIEQHWAADALTVTVHPASGDTSCVPSQRSWRLIIAGVADPGTVTCSVRNTTLEVHSSYDQEREVLTVSGIEAAPTDPVAVTITAKEGGLLARRDRTLATCERMLRIFRLATFRKAAVHKYFGQLLSNPGCLADLAAFLSRSQLRAISEIVLGAGADMIRSSGSDAFIAWNRGNSPLARYHFQSEWGSHNSSGTVPTFFRIGKNRKHRDEKNQLWPDEGYFASINLNGLAIPFSTADRRQ